MIEMMLLFLFVFVFIVVIFKTRMFDLLLLRKKGEFEHKNYSRFDTEHYTLVRANSVYFGIIKMQQYNCTLKEYCKSPQV